MSINITLLKNVVQSKLKGLGYDDINLDQVIKNITLSHDFNKNVELMVNQVIEDSQPNVEQEYQSILVDWSRTW